MTTAVVWAKGRRAILSRPSIPTVAREFFRVALAVARAQTKAALVARDARPAIQAQTFSVGETTAMKMTIFGT